MMLNDAPFQIGEIDARWVFPDGHGLNWPQGNKLLDRHPDSTMRW